MNVVSFPQRAEQPREIPQERVSVRRVRKFKLKKFAVVVAVLYLAGLAGYGELQDMRLHAEQARLHHQLAQLQNHNTALLSKVKNLQTVPGEQQAALQKLYYVPPGMTPVILGQAQH